MNLYPRSILSLILLGNMLVALPLLGAAGYTAYALNELVQQGEHSMHQASSLATLERTLPEKLEQMAGSLRQYQSRHEPAVLATYAVQRKELREQNAQLGAIPLLAPMVDKEASPLLAKEEEAYRRLQHSGQQSALDEPEIEALKLSIDHLKTSYHALLDQGEHQLIESDRHAFSAHIEYLRQELLLAQTLALIVVAIVLWLSRRQLSKQWHRFEHAVWALGKGRLLHQISIRGPDDMQRVGRRLEWLRCRLLALEEQRTLGLRHLSHELKTPLAALREGASLLQESAVGPLTEAQRKIVAIMHSNVLRQQELIDGLLKLQQIGDDGHHLRKATVALDGLLRQVLATHQLAARKKKLRLAGSLEAIEAYGGREELLTICDNLISNAIKFSPPGEQLYIALSRQQDEAVIDVADNGPGIGADDREKIFEPFYRSSSAADVAGTGLGLAIAYQFALAHNGRLELGDAASVGMRGAHFRLRLPLLRSAS